MKSKEIETKTTGIKSKSFSHQQLLDALYYIDDVLSRGAIPYFVIKETAESIIRGGELSGDGIYLGVRYTDWISSGMDIVSLVADAKDISKKLIEYDHLGVPITIEIFKKNHSCIESTDPLPYAMEYFYVPNPYQTFKKLYL